MSGLGDLLQDLIIWLYGLLWPFRIVNQWSQGVRTRSGKIQRPALTHENGLFKTGIHVFWPIIGDLEKYPSNVEVQELSLQNVRLRSGEELTFSLSATMRVRDWTLVYANVQDPDDSFREAIRGAAATLAREANSIDDFADKVAAGAVTDQAKADMRGWGVELKRTRLINLTAAQPLRLIMDHVGTSSPGSEE